jgi:uracil-DNA glycosylase family 4
LEHVENSYLLSNIITNEYGSINYQNNIYPFLFSGLCTEDKEKSDEILALCKSYHVDPEWEDSRCHPTGFFKSGNIMIVGEAPGRKGRALNSKYLKPSFIFTATSAILRFALFSRFKVCPYITNLLKYAKPGNEVELEDFKDNFDIIMREIELINPPMIIALGKNTARFLHQNLPDKYRNILRSYIHPAALTYRSIDQNVINNYAGGLYKLVHGDDDND